MALILVHLLLPHKSWFARIAPVTWCTMWRALHLRATGAEKLITSCGFYSNRLDKKNRTVDEILQKLVENETHIYPHKPLRKIWVTICKHQADGPLYVWPNVWSGDLQVLEKSMVIHDTECPYWDQVSLNNTKPNQTY